MLMERRLTELPSRYPKAGKHTVRWPQTPKGPDDPDVVLVKLTARRPWTLRAERRAANKRARASRKANRR